MKNLILTITLLALVGYISAECNPGFYECNDGRCIPENWICDGENDCAGGDDEDGCPPCDGFLCDNGKCISDGWVCDGDRDCPGGEDEIGCPCDGFLCDDGRCIPESYRCDDDNDCSGGEDERNCTCAPGKVSCPGSNKCIPDYWFCDFVRDCPDGSDEENCGTPPSVALTSDAIQKLEKEHRQAMNGKGLDKQGAQKFHAQKSAAKQCSRSASQRFNKIPKVFRNK